MLLEGVRQIVAEPHVRGAHDARSDGAREDGTQAETSGSFHRLEADGATIPREMRLDLIARFTLGLGC